MTPPLTANTADIKRHLALIWRSGDVYELRTLSKERGRQVTQAGFFDDADAFARAATERSGKVDGAYITLNPVDRALLARLPRNRLHVAGNGDTTSDRDVPHRRHLLVDFDAVRPAGISSTDEEHEAALSRASAARDDLDARGFSEPIFSDSGNGAHLVYATDDVEAPLIKRALDELAKRYSDDVIKVDTKVFNPARITKLYGTLTRKGENTPDRPHRLARIISAPAELAPVSREVLERIATAAPAASTRTATPGRSVDLDAWIAEHCPQAQEKPWTSGRKWIFPICPFDDGHAPDKAYITQDADGVIAAGCLRESCSLKSWRDLRARFEPRRRQEDDTPTNAPAAAPAPPSWSAPKPLPGRMLPPVRPFSSTLLPDDLRWWVEDVAERMQVAPDIVAVAAMCALAIVTANARTIQPKRFDPSWRVYSVLWGVVIAPAGSMKSPAIRPVEGMLMKLEIAAREQWEACTAERKLENEAAEMLAEARQAEIKKQVKDSTKSGSPFDAKSLAAMLKASLDQAPASMEHLRRLKATDTTTEKLAMLCENGTRRARPMVVWCDELAGLLNSFEREGHESDRALYLAGWSVSNHHVDRVGRGSLFYRDLALAIFGAMTPGPFEEYVREAAGGANADGFLQRLQLMVYPDQPARWRLVDRPPNRAAEHRAFSLYERLFALDEDDEDGKPPALRFAPDAQDLFDRWIESIEIRLRDPRHGMSEARAGHLAKYRSLMPAMALVCHLASGPGAEHEPVSLIAATRAVQWCEYLDSHADRVYAMARDGAWLEAEIVRRIEAGKIKGDVKLREIHRMFPDSVTADDVAAACEVLEEHGWIRLETVKPRTGRPTTVAHVNPLAGPQAKEPAA